METKPPGEKPITFNDPGVAQEADVAFHQHSWKISDDNTVLTSTDIPFGLVGPNSVLWDAPPLANSNSTLHPIDLQEPVTLLGVRIHVQTKEMCARVLKRAAEDDYGPSKNPNSPPDDASGKAIYNLKEQFWYLHAVSYLLSLPDLGSWELSCSSPQLNNHI
ncbi:hypothetical protein BTVI_30574 [Pitangus sulphuratus]|nr:hypothetical protein BTVI_30574 [Pitangus sulphuratus]